MIIIYLVIVKLRQILEEGEICMSKQEINGVCPFDCPDACGLVLTVENNKVLKVNGNPKHAFTRGTLCPKMVHYEDTIHSPERLQTPLKRVGPKGSGEFVPRRSP